MDSLCQDWKSVFLCIFFSLLTSHVATGPDLRIKQSVLLSCFASIAVCSILLNSAIIAVAGPLVLQAFFSCLALLKCMKVLPLTFVRFRRHLFSWFRLNENGLDIHFMHSASVRMRLSLLLISFFVIRLAVLTVCGFFAAKNLSSHLALKAQLSSLVNADIDQLRQLDDVCAICWGPFERHGKMTPCKHIFHSHCLRTWLRRRNVCPICNREVFSEAMVTS
ncbi:zf-RING 2 domain containing protein [Trichuris trichiura]|uniref:Zf-RING 2 domain containing protein n=1 Tax=Trichuris trichiura TaxID=36087 RepID=A0A077ZKE4_TRITR|nr:zf-RING 2 domain containing protein [Trichuris trichiura]